MGLPAKRFLTTFFALLALMLGLTTAAIAEEPGQHRWGPDNPNGNFLGAENLPCDGDLHWVFNPGGNHSITSATLSIEGDAETYTDQKPQAANFHFFTPGDGVDTTTEVVVTYEGDLGEGQATLTISECVPGEAVEDEDEAIDEEGEIRVAKEAIGDGAVPDEDFAFTLSCEEGDHHLTVAAGDASEPITAVGGFTDCTVEETTHHDAEVSWRIDHDDTPSAEGSGTTTDTFDVPAGSTVVVTFTNEFEAEPDDVSEGVLAEVIEREDEAPAPDDVVDAEVLAADVLAAEDELPVTGPANPHHLIVLSLLLLLTGAALIRWTAPALATPTE